MSDTPIFPQEIVADVLSRLPVKTLCRFKCVSHSWHALISDPHFAKTHFNRSNNMPDRLILLPEDDCSALYSVYFTADVPVATKLDFPSAKIESYHLLGSCNGLLLVLNLADNTNYLLNPSTRESKKLPKSPFALDWFRGNPLYGLGYDSSTDDYKIVTFSHYSEGTTTDLRPIVYVYSLKANSWRSIRGFFYVHKASDLLGVYANGGLHWQACWGSDNFSVILAFDLANESFREVPPPPSVAYDDSLETCLLGFGGCLCLHVARSDTQTEIWMMKEYGIRESWTKFTRSSPDLPEMELVCLLKDEEFLLDLDEGKLVLYNPKEGIKRDMVVCGIPTEFTTACTYVENLVSLDCGNGNMKRGAKE